MPCFGKPSRRDVQPGQTGLPDLRAGSGVWVYRRGSGGCGCSLVPTPKWRCRPGARVVLWSEPAMRFSHGTRRGSLRRVYRRCPSPVQPFAAWLAELPPDSTAVGFGGGACAWRLARAGERWRLATWTTCWWTSPSPRCCRASCWCSANHRAGRRNARRMKTPHAEVSIRVCNRQ